MACERERRCSDDDIIVCRCEDVTLGQIRKTIAEGVTTLDELKRLLRVGMGPCQGRTCRELVTRELSQRLGKSVGEVALPTFRPPSRPVRIGLLSKLSDDDRGEAGSFPEGGDQR